MANVRHTQAPSTDEGLAADCIPFNRPALVGTEASYITDVMRRGHAAGDGDYTRRCHAFLETTLGVRRALLTTSCTHALEMSALILDVGDGDEVIVPSFTFVSSINAFALRGARPVFADVRADTLNLDERPLDGLITDRTKAVITVHYAGVGCEMDSILEIARQRDVTVVEDNAHGLFGTYKGKPLGTFGALATQSFHETKNISCGEGGALLINDDRYVKRAEIIREKGTNRSAFFRGEIDKYTWVDLGSSYLPSELLSAFLWAQLEEFEQVQGARRAIWERYDEGLRNWAAVSDVGTPFVPAHCEHPYHMYYLLLPSLEIRDALIAHLRERGIMSVFHYVPLHYSPMGMRLGGRPGQCPVAEDVSQRIVRLPFFNDLTRGDQERVITAVSEFII
jgi:dTDP-4-amino-4,6-dideoxygalactose transaminase